MSSTQLVTDENGDQVARFIYGAWGEELYASESVPGVLENRFVGGLGCRKDAATGLIYMRHRWYDPALQRFISRDPIGLKGGTNLYKYAGNNPVSEVDALGLHPAVTRGDGAIVFVADENVTKEDFYAVIQAWDDIHYSTRTGKHMIDAFIPMIKSGERGVEGEYVYAVTYDRDTKTPIKTLPNGKKECAGSYINPAQSRSGQTVTIRMPDGTEAQVETSLKSAISHETGHGFLLEGDEMTVINKIENPIMTDPGLGKEQRPGPRIRYKN